MRVIDISRPLLTAPLYPGDPPPRLERLSSLDTGDDFTTSALYACLHTGTHLDAPAHALPDMPGVCELASEVFLGECAVVPFDGVMTGRQAEDLLARTGSMQRLLLKGQALLSPSAAFVLSGAGLLLLGCEGPSIAQEPYTLEVHRTLLGAGTALLEGLDLSGAAPDRYFLLAPPLAVQGAEASPVRAMLIARERLDWAGPSRR